MTDDHRDDSTSSTGIALRDHLGIAIPAAAVAITALRVYRVSHGDPSTAQSVLAHADLGGLVVATITDLVPVLALFVIVLLVAWFEATDRKVRDVGRWWVVIGALLTLQSVWILGLIGVLCVAAIPFLRRPRRWRHLPSSPWSRLLALGTLMAALQLVLVDSVWLPAEVVEIDGRPTTVYVLESSLDGAVVLRDRDRAILFLAPIEGRRICEPDVRQYDLTIAGGLFGIERTPDYPRCP